MFSIARRRSLVALVGAFACTLSFAPVIASADPNTDSVTTPAAVDSDAIIVTLSQAPLSSSTGVDRVGKKVNLQGARSKSVRASLSQQRAALKQWMKTHAPKAVVSAEYDYALNGIAIHLNGTNADSFRAAPGVTSVTFQEVITKAADDPDLTLVNAPAGWTAAGASSVEADPTTWAGFGVKVGIIDSGVDASHPCFDDTGFPATTQVGDTTLTNNKVIVAKVFNNKVNQNGFDASAVGAHGTHVAGTVACDLTTPASIGGADVPYHPSGVAPGAQLGNYNVFPGDVESARSEDIVAAMNAAGADGMDVINMSLGGGTHSASDLYTGVISNLDRAGVVVAIAQGNDGPGYGTIGSPGIAADALTVGASSVGHFVGTPILSSGAQVAVAATGDFPVPTSNLTAALGVVSNDDGTLSHACSALPEGSLTGQIALVSRGTCTFGNKVSVAEAAGAVAVIVVNNAPGDPAAMAADEAFPTTIPAVMVSLDDLETMTALDGQAVTIGADNAYARTGNDNILMGFSSWGPVPVSYAAKPDLVAPGGNVISSLPLTFCADNPDVATEGCWGLMSGTSMATPHVAGMAAVVKGAHPTWTAPQVRSAVANTATIDGVMQTNAITTVETDVLKVGNGLGDLEAAVNATLALSSTTVSFGAVPKAAGQTATKTVVVTNLTDTAITVPVSIEGAPGFSTSASSLTVPSQGTASVSVTWTSPKKSASSFHQAHLSFGDQAHVVLFSYLK